MWNILSRKCDKAETSQRRKIAMVEAGRRILVVASLGLLLSCLPTCAIRSTSSESLTILLFNGSGTSPNDVAAIEKILNGNDFSYTTANSRRLNEMSESQLRRYRLLIVPGGNFEQIGNGLTSSATANVRNAVHNGTPAIVEGNVGDGWVILSGIHPEAPESWRRGLTFHTTAGVDNAYAATLISSAMNRIRLEHY